MSRPIVVCAHCGWEGEHRGRGLCDPCYRWVHHHGRLADYERTTWPNAELMAEWELLRSEGYTRRQAAERLGISRDAIDKAIRRAGAT